MTTSAAFRAYTTSAAAYEAAATLYAWLRAAPSQAAFDAAKPAIDAAWAHADELERAEYAAANPDVQMD